MEVNSCRRAEEKEIPPEAEEGAAVVAASMPGQVVTAYVRNVIRKFRMSRGRRAVQYSVQGADHQ